MPFCTRFYQSYFPQILTQVRNSYEDYLFESGITGSVMCHSSLQGQPDAKFGSSALLRLYPDAPLVGLHDGLGNVKPQARTHNAPGDGASGAAVALKKLALLLQRDAGASIFDLNQHPLLRPGPQPDGTLAWTELKGLGTRQNLPEAHRS